MDCSEKIGKVQVHGEEEYQARSSDEGFSQEVTCQRFPVNTGGKPGAKLSLGSQPLYMLICTTSVNVRRDTEPFLSSSVISVAMHIC